jgi:hypothetical protein
MGCSFSGPSIVAGLKEEPPMAEFMVLIHESEIAGGGLPPGKTQDLIEEQAAYEQKLRAAEAFVDGERLRPSSEGRRVSRDREQGARVEVGPFDEPTLGAYYVLQASDLDAALELAAQCPFPPGAGAEVRPVMNGHFEPDKTSQKGRLFAFAVLGSAANERSWIDVMDRIDERTRACFPEHQFRGGARLEAPSRGRHISATGGRRAVLDGPFLESKEVIGGLFFLRMASLGEAIEWASASPFVDHGTLEIRELWRS